MPKIIPASEQAVVLTVPQFCERFAIGRDAFYREVREGCLRVVKVGMRTFVAKTEAARWFESKMVEAAHVAA